MVHVFLSFLPILIIFFLGFTLRKVSFFTKDHADFMLKLVFYIALPALIILSFSKASLTWNDMLLPLFAFIIMAVIFCIAYAISKTITLEPKQKGVFFIASLVMNVGFLLPFVIAVFGEQGLAKISLFDFGNGLLTFTFAYAVAYRYGNPGEKKTKIMLKKFLMIPPIWAIVIGLALNLSHIQIPDAFRSLCTTLGNMTSPLIMLALGIYFTPRLLHIKPAIGITLIRMGIGLILGIILTKIFTLDPLSEKIVLLAAAAPVGYNTLTFSGIENLDKEYAASIISFSILVGIILTPILLLVLT